MTFDDRVLALTSLGFSDRKTRFIVTVALHSGFCLRRHYAAFAGADQGSDGRDVLEALVERGLAERFRFRHDRGYIYHVASRGLYGLIGQHDNRNRRHIGPALIARKIMLLDYVLTEPRVEWLATEQDKVEAFTTRFGIPLPDLPQRVYRPKRGRPGATTRYFVHKLPIATIDSTPVSASASVAASASPDGSAGSNLSLAARPVVSFTFLVTDTTGQSFTQFMNDHARLIARLPAWRIVAVCPRHVPGLPGCEAAFTRFGAALRSPRSRVEVAALRQYLHVRDLVERGDVSRLPVADIQAFQFARTRFSTIQFEVLYAIWRDSGESVFEPGSRASAGLAAACGQLVTYRLPSRYDAFGSRPGIS